MESFPVRPERLEQENPRGHVWGQICLIETRAARTADRFEAGILRDVNT